MPVLLAQCVMCMRTAAAQQGARAGVLNSGILILVVPPLAIVAGILWLLITRRGGSR